MSHHTAHLTPEQVEQPSAGSSTPSANAWSPTSASATPTTSATSSSAQRALEVAGRGLLFVGFLPPAWLGGTAALSLSKILDNMEIGHNVMHGQYDWMRTRRLDGKTLRVGHRLPGRPVAPLAQLHAPHLHQHRRHGPRHRLRHPADVRGPAVAPVLPRQPGLRVPADGVLPVRRRAARPRNRADRAPARSGSPTSARCCAAIWRKIRRQTLKDYVAVPAAGRPVRAVRARRQR